jgi:predicted dehydrogenase
LRLGIVSTARINRLLIPGAKAADGVELVAVASRDRARAEEYARTWEIPRALGSYEELLEDPDIDAVYVSLPNGLHVEWSIRALEAGKHVLCEKPLDRRPAEVERAFDAADRSGRILMEAFMYRHHPQTRRLLELVRGGAIGELQLVRSAFSFTITNADVNVRTQPELDGGSLMDVGCYCISGSRLLAGEPERVYGEQVVEHGVDVRFHGTLRFPAGVVAQFDSGFVLPVRDELEAIGTDGSLFLDDPWHAFEPTIELRRRDGTEVIEAERADSYRLELENLAAAARGDAEPLLGRADALAQARVIEALYRSATAHEPVDL